MPLFEYNCQECNTSFELLVRNRETPTCPDCQSPRLEKLFSVPIAHTGTSSSSSSELPMAGRPCGMGGCGRPECEI
ncbi:MAG: FmdB family transcriptional regulator [Planctomycetaceae bacterium]|nr:FmdB family transcriptional regulator [Planctomycetaceae bacterium]MBP61826.1 FmdB family transcriptional regulator [Planctomycetaceae bacterium]